MKLRVDKKRITEVEKELPEFPDAKKQRFLDDYSISESDAEEITQDRQFGDYFEEITKNLINRDEKIFRVIANILRVDVKRILNEKKIELKEFHLDKRVIAMLADSVFNDNISVTASKEIFNKLLQEKTMKNRYKFTKKPKRIFLRFLIIRK